MRFNASPAGLASKLQRKIKTSSSPSRSVKSGVSVDEGVHIRYHDVLTSVLFLLAVAGIILPMLLSKRISVSPAPRPFSFPASVNTRIPHRYTRPRKERERDDYGIRLPHKRLIYRCVALVRGFATSAQS